MAPKPFATIYMFEYLNYCVACRHVMYRVGPHRVAQDLEWYLPLYFEEEILA